MRLLPVLLLLLMASSSRAASRTIGPGDNVEAAVQALRPGDTLTLRPGTYDVSLSNPPGGTSWRTPVTIAGTPGQTILRGTGERALTLSRQDAGYLIVRDLVIDASNTGECVKTTYTGDGSSRPRPLRLQNVECKGANNQGLLIDSRDNEFLNLHVHGVATKGQCFKKQATGQDYYCHGIYLQSGGNLIDGGQYHDIEGNGIDLYNGEDGDAVSNNVIRNITAYNNGDAGIYVSGGRNNLVCGNRVYQNGRGIAVQWGARGTRIIGNIAHDNRRAQIDDTANSGGGTVQEDNALANVASVPQARSGGMQRPCSVGSVTAAPPPVLKQVPAPWNLRIIPQH